MTNVNANLKDIKIAFEQVIAGFEDALTLSKKVTLRQYNGLEMERSQNTVWVPLEDIQTSGAGDDVTNSFKSKSQLSVPFVVNQVRHSTFQMTAIEMLDALRENRLGKASTTKLASDINKDVTSSILNFGGLVVSQSGAPVGYDDISKAAVVMDSIGIMENNRVMALHTDHYHKMSGNLASRQTVQGKVQNAYEKAYLGEVSGFDTFKVQYTGIINAADSTKITMDTRSSANNYLVPVSTRNSEGIEIPVDNRVQVITVSDASKCEVGDAYQIDGITFTHMEAKQDSMQPFTTRVVAVNVGSNQITITPPIISAQGASEAEKQYQNCVVDPAANAGITKLNTVKSQASVFWDQSSIVLIPGTYGNIPSGSGAIVKTATLENGLGVMMTQQYDANTNKTNFAFRVRYGVTNVDRGRNGIILFNQTK
jgi:hypothetical protein